VRRIRSGLFYANIPEVTDEGHTQYDRRVGFQALLSGSLILCGWMKV
jgi:hypothetical protein